MEGNREEDMFLFQAGYEQTPGSFLTQSLDDFTPTSRDVKYEGTDSPVYLNPSDLTVKQESNDIGVRGARSLPSSNGSSRSSSSNSVGQHNRNVSVASTASPNIPVGPSGLWSTGISGLSMPSGEDMFSDATMTGIDNDFEASNEQMASDFDFETAASTPSAIGQATLNHSKTGPAMQPFRKLSGFNSTRHFQNTPSPRLPATQPPFYFGTPGEASPMSAMLPAHPAPSPWTKQSPSSGLEETFNEITMNGDSPGNATFPPNMPFTTNNFTFDPDSSGTSSTFGKDIPSPPSTIQSNEGANQLTVYPTSLKSRVETQIPIKMILSPLPPGVTKLRLPTHTVSKPKFLAKPEIEKSPEILELSTSLVCTSAMQDPVRLERAYARARGEELGPLHRPSPAGSDGSQSSRDDEDKPLNGGEVRICPGCIQRERKRASRKKQKRPDEEELFQKDEEKRVVVFNTNELKEWAEPTKDVSSSPSMAQNPSSQFPPGSMQVELPMRIACYCRHQNEKLGFRVIFTIKDYREKVIAQAITNSIMITDDHKTHAHPSAMLEPSPVTPSAPQLPGAGVFPMTDTNYNNGHPTNSKLSKQSVKQSYSTTDLHGLQNNFNPNFPMTPSTNPFAISGNSITTSASLTPRNLSRPASPSALLGPITKRRKQSGSGKIPSGLTMTRLETAHAPSGSSTMPNTAASSPYPQVISSFTNQADRGFAMPVSRPSQFGTSPPTPNGNTDGYIAPTSRSYSMENLSRQAYISAPSSRQPSRPNSPGTSRNGPAAAEPNFGQALSHHLMGQPSRRPPPLIHKLVPAEGSVTGGTEVTVLGNGFYQGLEIMFGDTEATTTTFWGEKCLNCIAPPAIQPGVVPVVFKHEHAQFLSVPPQSQMRTFVFTYVDDRELELYRLALKTVGKSLQNPTDDPYSAAEQVLSGPVPSYWPTQSGYGGAGGLQRQRAVGREAMDVLELESYMLMFLQYLDIHMPLDPARFDMSRPSGLTLLHLGASLGLTRFVAGLLSRGASPDTRDNGGNTAMHHAALNSHLHIIHRLRAAGGSNRIPNIKNFVPADLATSLIAYQAAVIPSHHCRSRSAGSTPMGLHSRNPSPSSLRQVWDSSSSTVGSFALSDDSSEQEEAVSDSIRHRAVLSHSTDMTIRADNALPRSVIQSRRPSGVDTVAVNSAGGTTAADGEDKGASPLAYMMAWRDSLATQIHQFHESAQWGMPNLPSLPALPPIPDYQVHPMARRISSLFPPRPQFRPASRSGNREGWWESLTGISVPHTVMAPPAYNELFPAREDIKNDLAIKKSSAIEAAADAAADLHFVAEDAATGSSNANIREKPTTSDEHVSYNNIHIQRVELSRDRKLFFFWIPLLAFLLALMLRNVIPDTWLNLGRINAQVVRPEVVRVAEIA